MRRSPRPNARCGSIRRRPATASSWRASAARWRESRAPSGRSLWPGGSGGGRGARVGADPTYLEARMGLVEYYVRAPRLLGGDRAKASEMAAAIARQDASQGYLARKFFLRGRRAGAEEERLDLQAAETNHGSYEIQI